MKICLIIHSLNIGGMERVMSILANQFSQYENTEVHLLLIGRNREIRYPIHQYAQVHKPNWIFDDKKRIYHSIKTSLFIRHTLKLINPDTVLSFGEMWNNLVLLSTKGLDYPIYISERSEPNKNLGILHNFLKEKLYPSAKGLIVQTLKAKNIYEVKKMNANICVIGNPVPVICESDRTRNTILNVGRLIKTKHIDRLIQIFICAKTQDWELVIVGGNAKKLFLLEKYRADVAASSLTHCIKLVGEQQNVIPFYASAKIFAFTSSSEGFPNALAEAMAAGCACIAYDCVAGPSDIIDDGINGFLIPLGDEAQYIEKLKLLMDNEDLRLQFGKAAQQKMKQFEARAIAERFYRFITEKV